MRTGIAGRRAFILLAIVTSVPMCALGQEPGSAGGDNPFFSPYGTTFNTPPFDRIRKEHFLPAVKEGIRRHEAEIDAIVSNQEAPTFANTLGALDAGGLFLAEANGVFNAMQGANTSPEIKAIAREVSPPSSTLLQQLIKPIYVNARANAPSQTAFHGQGAVPYAVFCTPVPYRRPDI